MALSDRAFYGPALELLNKSVARADRCGRRRQAAFSLSLIGRVHLLRGDVAAAAVVLDESLALVAAERWAAFRPWPEALRAEAALRAGAVTEATAALDPAFRLACRLGDPCWEAMTVRLAGLIAAAGRRSRCGARALRRRAGAGHARLGRLRLGARPHPRRRGRAAPWPRGHRTRRR